MANIIKSGALIPINDNNGKKAVNARDLANFLFFLTGGLPYES